MMSRFLVAIFSFNFVGGNSFKGTVLVKLVNDFLEETTVSALVMFILEKVRSFHNTVLTFSRTVFS